MTIPKHGTSPKTSKKPLLCWVKSTDQGTTVGCATAATLFENPFRRTPSSNLCYNKNRASNWQINSLGMNGISTEWLLLWRQNVDVIDLPLGGAKEQKSKHFGTTVWSRLGKALGLDFIWTLACHELIFLIWGNWISTASVKVRVRWTAQSFK